MDTSGKLICSGKPEMLSPAESRCQAHRRAR